MKKKQLQAPVKTRDFAGLGIPRNNLIRITVHEQSWTRLDQEIAQKKLEALAKAGILYLTVEREA